MMKKEVSISYITSINDINMTLFGRIDGILDGNTLLEIKSTKRHLDLLFVENISHLAQLKLYAFMYMKNEGLETVKGTLTLYL